MPVIDCFLIDNGHCTQAFKRVMSRITRKKRCAAH